MKKVITIFVIILNSVLACAQGFLNTGAKIYIAEGAYILSGNFQDASTNNQANITLNGSLEVTGDFTNTSDNHVFSDIEPAPNGNLILNGTENTKISGSTAVHFENLTLRNGHKILEISDCKEFGIMTLDAIFELNSNTFIVENTTEEAIIYLSGCIVSENPPADGLGILIRKTDASVSEYASPFGTGEGVADLQIVVSTADGAGFGSGEIRFATFPTNTSNQPTPDEVSAILDFDPAKTADRYWLIQTDVNSDLTYNIDLKYTESDIYQLNPDIFQLYRYNETLSTWTDFLPETSSGTLQISGQVIPADKMGNWWTIGELTEVLDIPNAITPDGDGYNDTWKIENCVDCKIIIYNRWGDLIYQSDNYDNSWDGATYPSGAYFYHLERPGKEPIDGNVNIMR